MTMKNPLFYLRFDSFHDFDFFEFVQGRMAIFRSNGN